MQQNLGALIPAKETALRGFISDCVNDPNRRHGVARAFLDQAQERFRAYAEALGKSRDQAKETLAPSAEARDKQLAEITRYAGDTLLGLVMGAKKREIDEAKDTFLGHARRWDTTLLDIRSAEAAIHFYSAMLVVLDGLKAEMDQYIERMRSLEAFFRKQEQDAIESPVDVNGAVLFDRGRREERDGVVTYVDGDIDRRYAAYVGDGMDPGNAIVNTASGDVLDQLGTSGNIYGTRDADRNRIQSVLHARARQVFAPVETESVLQKFFEKFGSGTDRSVEELRRVFSLSTPFIHLQENAPNYKHHQNKEQTIVGKIHGAEARDETEGRFLAMLKDTVQGIRDGQISNSNEQHQVLFLRERAAFPLRLLEGMESYRFAYDQSRAQGASANPIHTRRDVREWVRINPPSFREQKEAWQTFCVGWASQVIGEERDTRYTATGAKETVRFIASYRDRFGMPKTDPLGTFVSITGDMARLMRESAEKNGADGRTATAGRPPLEAREIVLILCDNAALKQQLDQGIEEKLHELGVSELGNRLVAHVQAQERALPGEIYRPYQQAISDYLEQINYAGPAAAMPVTPVAAPLAAPAGNGGAALAGPTLVQPAPAALPQPSSGGNAGASTVQNLRERLANLKSLFDDGLITQEDFDTRRAAILAEV
jgi:hypothetical protein